jgi:hypothetical protein
VSRSLPVFAHAPASNDIEANKTLDFKWKAVHSSRDFVIFGLQYNPSRSLRVEHIFNLDEGELLMSRMAADKHERPKPKYPRESASSAVRFPFDPA